MYPSCSPPKSRSKHNILVWIPGGNAGPLLDRWSTEKITDPLLARLTVPGNLIRGPDPHLPSARRYPDGDTLGRPASDGHTAPGGMPATDLVSPIGDGRRGGNFQMWFWLRDAILLINPSDIVDFATVSVGREVNRSVRLSNTCATPVKANVSVTGAAGFAPRLPSCRSRWSRLVRLTSR